MSADYQPVRRVVILGASNIARNFGTVVANARHAWDEPIDLLAAFGHGRSYGLPNNVLGRTLPAITRCGIWHALASRPSAETAVLVTDIGNDILYGAEANQIAQWVQECLERVAPQADRIAITELPLASIEKLGPLRFLLARTVLFPQSRLQLADAIDMARRLNDQLADLAVKFGATLVSPAEDWYGFDPIHIRARHTRSAWRTILASWHDSHESTPAHSPILHSLRLRFARPEHRHLFGIEQRTPQPAAVLDDGTWLSLF